MIGRSPPMVRLARLVSRCAPMRVATLLRGESGSGKELVARALHALGDRPDSPFIAVNAAGLGETLGASALFGHVRGAFTGASDSRLGAFRRAGDGSLFIDEIASLSPRLQAQLLRVIEEGVVTPLGSDEESNVGMRLITATCEPLEQQVARGAFRADLYQRLSACVIGVPPLRDRRADIPLLTRSFCRADPLNHHIDPDALPLLRSYSFPGNVRELRNILIQAALYAEGPTITESDIRIVLAERSHKAKPTPAQARALVAELNGNISAAARTLRLPRSTFRDLLKRS